MNNPDNAQGLRLSVEDVTQGWHQTFSTSNPFCPCDLKSFGKAAAWAEREILSRLVTHPPQQERAADPEWLVGLRNEIKRAAMKDSFCLSRNEVIHLLGGLQGVLAAHPPQQERAAVADGWVLVPRVPTSDMLNHAMGWSDDSAHRNYAAMLAAAPAAPATPESAEPVVSGRDAWALDVALSCAAAADGPENRATIMKARQHIAARLAATSDPTPAASDGDAWREAVLDELALTHIHTDAAPRDVLKAIIQWHVDVARDPQVSDSDGGLRDELLIAAVRHADRSCPCGARGESPETHPHAPGCPVGAAMGVLSAQQASAPAAVAPEQVTAEVRAMMAAYDEAVPVLRTPCSFSGMRAAQITLLEMRAAQQKGGGQ